LFQRNLNFLNFSPLSFYGTASILLQLKLISFVDNSIALSRTTTMAEALGLAASAASFVGLAGQILQGCQNIRTFLDDVKDASSDLQNLSQEVIAFESGLTTFKQLLDRIERDGYDISYTAEQVTQALNYSDQAVQGLQKLISKYKEGGLTLWRQVGVAFRKDKLEKRSRSLEKAKLHLLITQVNINL
jgi:hypothetical protein